MEKMQGTAIILVEPTRPQELAEAKVGVFVMLEIGFKSADVQLVVDSLELIDQG